MIRSIPPPPFGPPVMTPSIFPLPLQWCVAAIILCACITDASGAEQAVPGAKFLRTHCVECHQGTEAAGGFDLTTLMAGEGTTDAAAERRWVRIIDRVRDGEMPPKDVARSPAEDITAFVRSASNWLSDRQQAQFAESGRVRGRRLTKREVERSLQALLGIDIPLADQLPDEAMSTAYSTIASGQAMSHFQLERHLAVVDVALEEAYRRAFSEPDEYDRTFDVAQIARQNPKARNREPEIYDDAAVIWSSGLIFYGRLPTTTAPESGWYRFTVKASSLKPPESGGVWCTVRSGPCVSSAPLLAWVASFEATAEPRTWTFEAWLPRGHMLEIRPGDTMLKKARFNGGQVGAGEGQPQDVPGVAFHEITMQRFHRGLDNHGVRKLLFGDRTVSRRSRRDVRLESASPKEDARRLLATFARRAFRRPVSNAELAPYIALANDALDAGEGLSTALRIGYRAILCSPRFLYFTESPGMLDDHALATRLSYFLTGGPPDAALNALAEAGRLHDPAVLRHEAERLLSDAGGRRFIEDFAAEWLDLDQIDFTEPDGKLFPQFDSIVQHSMLNETQAYLETMLRDNISVTALMDSDFTFLNSRLARFYDIDGVTGDELRPVALEPRHRRGGVLTQGAVMKVTANGSNTSPVIRGVWVSERLLGEHVPPPPDNVPAIEPDIRGAKTIRELLAKHRSQAECASCHVKIDPPGFALENFDPAGQWRERYVQLDDGRRKSGAEVDASYVLPDGREFRDVAEFQRLMIADPRKLARNVAEHLLVYGTGAPIAFADREAVDAIVDQAAGDGYGFRSLLLAVVGSPVFQSK